MNKKFLSAVLFGALMVGSSVTFTGCIDNDEPAGIETLRGAKAELLKAKAAVELANEAWVRAQVANQELLNKGVELQNQYAEIDVKLHELDLAIKEAASEAEIAKYQQQKADWENQKALDAQNFQTQMTQAQMYSAQAQAAYDAAIKEIEASKLLLTDEEKTILNTAQTRFESAATMLNYRYSQLTVAQKAYYAALIAGDIPTLEKLEAELVALNAEVEIDELKLKEQERMLVLAEDFDAEKWDAEIVSLKAKIQKTEVSRDSAEVEAVALKRAEKYQNAEKYLFAVTDSLGEQVYTKGSFNAISKLYDDGTFADKNATSTDKIKDSQELTTKAKYLLAKSDSTKAFQGQDVTKDGETIKTGLSVKEYKSDPIAQALKEFFAKTGSGFDNLAGYNAGDGVFSYDGGTSPSYTQEEYLADLKTITEKGDKVKEADVTTQAAKNLIRVDGWLAALDKFTADGNGTAWAEIMKAQEEEALKGYKETYDARKGDWEIAMKAYKIPATKTDVPTTDVKKATDAYNVAFAAVKSAVEAYNKAYDAAYKEEESKEFEKKYLNLLKDVVGGDSKDGNGLFETTALSAWNTQKNQLKTSDAVIAFMASYTVSGKEDAVNKEKAIAKVTTEEHMEKDATINGLHTAVNTVLGTSGTDLFEANAALDKAIIAENTAKTAVVKAFIGNKGYDETATYPYAQERTADAKKYLDLTDDKYVFGKGVTSLVVDAKDADGKIIVGHKALAEKASDISADELTAMTATEINATLANDAAETSSKQAFGGLAWDANTSQYRATEPTRAEAEKWMKDNNKTTSDLAAFGDVLKSEDNIALYTSMMSVGDLVAPLKAQIETVKANLEAEITANTAKINAYATAAQEAWAKVLVGRQKVAAALDARKAISAAVDAAVAKYSNYVLVLKDILSSAEKQISDMAPGGISSPITAESLVAYWKSEIAKTKEDIETSKTKVVAKEKEIELFKNGEYTKAYEIEQKKVELEIANTLYNEQLAVYNQALADLNRILEAFTK